MDAVQKYGDARVRQGHSNYDLETAARWSAVTTLLATFMRVHDEERSANPKQQPTATRTKTCSVHDSPKHQHWYWVHYISPYGTVTAPAQYNGELQTWQSHKFSGIGADEVEVLEQITEPHLKSQPQQHSANAHQSSTASGNLPDHRELTQAAQDVMATGTGTGTATTTTTQAGKN